MAASEQTEALTIESARLASIAYHVVGVHTEAGRTPYTGAANAGGASGLSIGTMQHDFGQRPSTAPGYASAIVDWYASNGRPVGFTVDQLATGILKKTLTSEQRVAAAEFGASGEGAKWIFDNLEKSHVDAAVQAAQQAFATPYGQAVLTQGTHVEEFAAFSMKVFNQYGGGPLKINGEISGYKLPGFQGLLAYLNNGQVELRDNRSGHDGETIAIAAKSPDQFDRDDLLAFSRGYASTRNNQSETNSPALGDNRAIISGPQSALSSGALYSAILDSDSPLGDVLKRVEAKGDFSPTLVATDPDVALTRAIFGADTGRMNSAVAAINDATTLDPISISATLGQYPGTLWIDPLSGRIALSYKDSNSGFVIDSNGYAKFASSTVVKDDGVRTLQIGEGDAAVSFDQIPTPLANAPLPRGVAVTPPIGHWEEQTIYTDLGLPLTTRAVWVLGPAVINAMPTSPPSSVIEPSTNHITTGTIYLSRDGASATLPDGQVINAGSGGRLELGADGNLSATRPVTGYSPDEAVYSVTLYNKNGQTVANTQIQVVADPAHPNDPAYNTTVVQGQVRDVTQIQPDGLNIIVRTVFQTGTGWVEQGTGEIVQTMAEWNQARLVQTRILRTDSFGADGGDGDGDGDGGGDGDGDEVDPPLNVVDIPAPDLVSHFAGVQNSGAYGAGQLAGLDVLPFNDTSSFLINADGVMVGEINHLSSGWIQIRDTAGGSVYLNPQAEPGDPNAIVGAQQYQDVQDAQAKAQASQVASAVGLMNSIIGLQHWDNMSDLQRTAAVASIYNVVDKLTGEKTLPGDLGTAASVLGLLNALDKGDAGGVLYSGLSLVEHLTSTAGVANSGWVSNNLPGGGDFLPGLGFVLALDSGDPVSITSSGLSLMSNMGVIGPWGATAAAVITVLGSLFADEPDIPMREGLAHAEWDGAGNTCVITEQDVEGGGATATGWTNSLVDGLQAQLSNTRDAAGNSYALIPNLLPAIGFQYDPDGFNLANGAMGFVYLKWTDESGQSQTRYYDGAGNRGDGTRETLAGDFMQHAAGAIAPAWQVETVLAHYQQGQGIQLPNSEASLPQELADGIHQTLQALTLALPVEPALNNALIDIDGDGYLERTQWLANNQQILGVDANGDGLIGTSELLSLNGPTTLNSLNWLDANGDRILNASDPGFPALRLWMDVNADADSSGETQTMTQAGIVAIDFGSNPPAVVYADGNRTLLTAQALTGDVLGITYQAVIGGVLQLDEQQTGLAMATLHAVNTREFDGQADHMHGGDAAADGETFGESTVDAGDARLVTTTANTITTQTAQTSATLIAGDTRLRAGVAGAVLAGQVTAQTPGIAQVSSNGIVYVPAGAVSLGAQIREATEAMVRSAETGSLTPLMALAVGAAVQWPTLVTAASSSQQDGATAVLPGTPPVTEFIDWQTWDGSRFSVAASDSLVLDAQMASPLADLPGQVGANFDASNMPPAQVDHAHFAINSVADGVPLTSTSTSTPSVTDHDTLPEGGVAPMLQTSDVVLDFPQTHGEQASSREDTGLRFLETLLLANDSTVNAPAFPNQPSLRISSVFAPVHGSVSLQVNAQGVTEVVFLPEANYHGPASFDYTVTDQYGLSNNARANLSIAAVNDAPVTQGETANGDEDTSLLFTAASLLANDSDVDTAVDGDVLRITRVGMAEHGQVFLAPDGIVRFVPDANYNGPARFSYWVGDRDPVSIAAGVGYETPATVNLTVLAVNDLPVVTGESMDSDEDIILNINPALLLANDTDVDTATTNAQPAQVLSITAVGNAQHGGIALLPDGTLQFTPERDYFGAASFSYTVDDGHGGQVQGQVVVNLAPVNDAPVVMGETVTFNEDEVQTITQAILLANDSDVDNPHIDLRIVSVENATHGAVSLNPDGSIRFTPDADYFGPARFTYTVTDGVGGFTVGLASLDISPVNDAPRLVGEAATLDEDTQARFDITALLANDVDVDNLHGDLTITAAGNASHGSVQLVAGEIAFTPDLNFNGQASFTYTVSDGVGGLSEATVNLSFNPVNDAPVANSELIWGKRNVSYTLTQAALLANDTDVESAGALRVSAISNVQHGTAVLNANGSVSFTPEAGYAGRGSFDYVVQDPDGATSSATAQIDFSRINVPPVATDDSFIGYEDVAFSITAAQLMVNDSDADNPTADLQVTAVTNAQNGTVSLQADGSVRFMPTADFHGTASFQYQVSDGDGGQTWAVAQLNVQSVNDAPIIEDIFFGRPIYGYQLTYQPSGGDGGADLTYIPIYNLVQAVSVANTDVLFDRTLVSTNVGPEGDVSYGYSYSRIVPAYYRNGDMRPVAMEALDARIFSADITNPGAAVDDLYRQNGSVVAYDPDGNSSAITFGIASGPQHGHAWANQYTDLNAERWIDHTQAPALAVSQTGAWQYYSQRGDTYSGADAFTIAVTDSGGASTTVTINTAHVGSTASGGGGGKPVTLDLNGNGLQYVGLDDSKAYFDVNSDGWREHLAWTAGGDGLLARDIGGDRVIERFDEISFVNYLPEARTDLEGLAAFDSNGNGLLDRLDARWREFGAWEDFNGDGVSQAGEFHTLDEIGITQIGLQSDHQVRQLDGVTELGQSRFSWADGKIGAVGDVAFAVDDANRLPVAPIATAPVSLTPEHMALLMVQVISTATADWEKTGEGSVSLGSIDPQDGQDAHQALAAAQAQWEQTAQAQAVQLHGVAS